MVFVLYNKSKMKMLLLLLMEKPQRKKYECGSFKMLIAKGFFFLFY